MSLNIAKTYTVLYCNCKNQRCKSPNVAEHVNEKSSSDCYFLRIYSGPKPLGAQKDLPCPEEREFCSLPITNRFPLPLSFLHESNETAVTPERQWATLWALLHTSLRCRRNGYLSKCMCRYWTYPFIARPIRLVQSRHCTNFERQNQTPGPIKSKKQLEIKRVPWFTVIYRKCMKHLASCMASTRQQQYGYAQIADCELSEKI